MGGRFGMGTDKTLEEEIAWDNWRFQVDSGWNRSNYFAVVETVALAGAWQVLSDSKHPKTGVFFAFLGLLSTIVWFLNDLINHSYILYWWKSAGYSQQYEKQAKRWWPKVGLKYSHLLHLIPGIFLAAWVCMLVVFIPSPRCCYVLAVAAGLMSTWILLAILKKAFDSTDRTPNAPNGG